jgi:predicted PurR-regulated permease PerM
MEQQRTTAIAPRSLVLAIALVLAVGFAPHVATFASLVVLGLILGAALEPGVRFLVGRLAVSRENAVMVVFGGLVVAVAGVGFLVVPTVLEQASTLATDFPRYVAKLEATFAWATELAKKYPQLPAPPNLAAIAQAASQHASAWLGSSLGFAGKLLGWLVMALIVLTLAFFVLMEGPALRTGFLALVPPPHRRLIGEQIDPIALKLGGYVQGMAFSIAVLAVFQVIVLSMLGLPLALALGLLSALLAVVPMVGGLLGVIPPALVALSVSWHTAVWALLLGYLGHLIVANFLMPIVFARSVKLSPLMITAALLIGGEAGGMFGALVAVPVAAAIQVLVQNLYVGVMERRYAASERATLKFADAPLVRLRQPEVDLI